MELITFTTPQIHSIFAALSCAAVAGFIFYCVGLRTGKAAGYELGRETSANHWRKLLDSKRIKLEEATTNAGNRLRELLTLRENIKSEADDHAKVERGLLNRLAAAAPLSDEDHAVLLAVGAKLELAADTFAGIGAPDHARFSRHLQAQVLDIADRIKKAQANAQPHPDSELIDWLDANAGFSLDFQTATLYFDLNPASLNPVTNTLREVVRRAMDQSEPVAIEDVSLSLDLCTPIDTGNLEIFVHGTPAKQEDVA